MWSSPPRRLLTTLTFYGTQEEEEEEEDEECETKKGKARHGTALKSSGKEEYVNTFARPSCCAIYS